MAVHPTFYHLDLCSGSGMLGVAVKLALRGNLRTIGYVEREAYAAASIVARMEDEGLDFAPVWDDLATCRSDEFLRVVGGFAPLIVTAGYPCQPFSVAGRHLGTRDERHLWPLIDDLVGRLKPCCCFFENVPGHIRLGLGEVRRNLKARGYGVANGIFSAEEVGASHPRKRLFILALADAGRCNLRGQQHQSWQECDPAAVPNEGVENLADPGDGFISRPGRRTQGGTGADDAGTDVADARATGLPVGLRQRGDDDQECPPVERDGLPLFAPAPHDLSAWRDALDRDPSLEPAIRRVADGLASGLDSDRLRVVGNGVVPLAAAYAFVSLFAALTSGGRMTR